MGRNENWYIVLGLEFDPPVEDEAEIKQRIDEKVKYWIANINHFRYGNQYRMWKDSVNKIKTDMLGPSNRRKELAAEAFELEYAPIDEKIKKFAINGEIKEEGIDRIAFNTKTDKERVKKRCTALGVRIHEFDQNFFDKVIQPILNAKPISSVDNSSELRQSGKKNLYDFLSESDGDLSALSSDELLKIVENKRKNYMGHTSKDSIGEKICSLCATIFKTEKSKSEYDESLKNLKLKEVLEDIKIAFRVAGRVNSEIYDKARASLNAVFSDKDTEKIISLYCEKEGIPYTVGAATQSTARNVIECRCGAFNDEKKEICFKCGRALKLKCPKCSKLNNNNVNFCSCGFDLRGIERSRNCCSEAKECIRQGDIENALSKLREAKHHWSDNPDIDELTKGLDELKRKIENVNNLINDKKFYEAKQVYNEARRIKPEFKDKNLEKQIDDAISEAKRLFDIAKIQRNDQQAVRYCDEALNYCKDYPGISEYRKTKVNIPSPNSLSVTLNTELRANILRWNYNNTVGQIRFKIIRKQDSAPRSETDGQCIALRDEKVYTDTNIIAGETYYYAVFAEVDGIYSKPAVSTAITSVLEVEDLNVSSGDEIIRLKWKKLPDTVFAYIYSVLNGKETEITKLKGTAGCTIRSLSNEKEYTYRIKLGYSINGIISRTDGVIVKAIPTKPPVSVTSLNVAYKGNGEFGLEWSYDGDLPIAFYSDDKRFVFNEGDTIPLDRLYSMTLLKTQDDVKNIRQTIVKPDKSQKYIAAFTIKQKSNVAMVGSVRTLNWMEPVEIKKGSFEDDRIRLILENKSSSNITDYLVQYASDGYPKFDKNACIRFSADKNEIILDNISPEAETYYIAVYTVYNGNRYSPPCKKVLTRIKTIEYTKTIEKKFLKKTVRLVFKLRGDLPDVDILQKVGGLPLVYDANNIAFKIRGKSDKGKIYYSFEGGIISENNLTAKFENGRVSITFPLPEEKDVYIRPFLSNHKLNDGKYHLNAGPGAHSPVT